MLENCYFNIQTFKREKMKNIFISTISLIMLLTSLTCYSEVSFQTSQEIYVEPNTRDISKDEMAQYKIRSLVDQYYAEKNTGRKMYTISTQYGDGFDTSYQIYIYSNGDDTVIEHIASMQYSNYINMIASILMAKFNIQGVSIEELLKNCNKSQEYSIVCENIKSSSEYVFCERDSIASSSTTYNTPVKHF